MRTEFLFDDLNARLPTRNALVVTRGCDVLALQNWYAAGSVQCPTWSACLELCCTACPSAHHECSCIVLSTQWQTPLHVGDFRHGGRRSTGVPYYSFSLPLPFTDRHDSCCGRLTGLTDHCALLSIGDFSCPNRFPSGRFCLSLQNYRTWSSFRVPPHLVFFFASSIRNPGFSLSLFR
jgi:hypothetical protein